jgi:hypothetical protein
MKYLWMVALSSSLALLACDKDAAPAPGEQNKPSAPASAPASSPASAPGSAPASQATSAPVENGPLEATGQKGRYRFALKLKPASPRVGELFQVETTVTDAKTGQPVPGLDIKVDATMPDHRHGMMTRPVHKELGQGRYQSQGMKMHMSGRWELRVDAHGEGKDDTAAMDWHQSPISVLGQDKPAPKAGGQGE